MESSANVCLFSFDLNPFITHSSLEFRDSNRVTVIIALEVNWLLISILNLSEYGVFC